MMKHIDHPWRHRLVSGTLFLSLVLFLVACGGRTTVLQSATTTSHTNTVLKHVSMVTDNAAYIPSSPRRATTYHNPAAVGIAQLVWNQQDRSLTVFVFVTGLASNSTHPDHIHAGSCASNPMGPIVYSLKPLIANVYGDGTSRTVIKGVNQGILTSGWYVNVHQGPTLNTEKEAMPIACGNIHGRTISTHGNQSVSLPLIGSETQKLPR